MIGILREDLIDKLLNGHEAEFTYDDMIYSIESELLVDSNVIKIWECVDEPLCIAEVKATTRADVEALFDAKCFAGKSLNEIDDHVIVDNVF